jgi:hypothetical protein
MVMKKMRNEEKIRQKAYEIWELAGRPDEKHAAHWDQAIVEIYGRDSAVTESSGGVESSVAAPAPKSKPKAATKRNTR